MPSATFVPHPQRRGSVVSGASSGMGAAVAVALAAAGHPVVLGARRVERCEEVAASIRTGGGEAHVHRLDLAEAASVEDFARAAEEAVGPVDILVSSAGHAAPGTALDHFSEGLRPHHRGEPPRCAAARGRAGARHGATAPR